MYNYDTVTQAIADLQKRGYVLNFNIVNDLLKCVEHSIELHPEEFTIDEVYRFEGNSDPGDEMVVYAISSLVNHLKGILTGAYGTYADISSTKLIEKLSYHASNGDVI